MQKLILALIGCIISVAVFAQTKCKYDHDKYDDMLKIRKVWIEEKVGGGVGSKWWFKLANYGGSKVLTITARFGSRLSFVIGTSDPLMLKFQNVDSVYKVYSNEVVSSKLFQGVAPEITVTYYLTDEIIELLSTQPLDKVRMYFTNSYWEANVKKGEAEKIQKSANCVYKQL